MRAAVIDRLGPPEVLRLAELPEPEPGEGEVLVRTALVGVNYIDAMTRAGSGVTVDRFPAVLGWDIAGVVVRAGSGVTQLREGDAVFGMPRFPRLAGAYAELVVAPATELALKPPQMSDETAAGAPMVGLTAWQAVFSLGKVTAGQRVLIHGASGGVGHVAVQLARWAGAEVIGIASAPNHDFVRGLGASRVVDYAASDLEQSIADVDVAIDHRGGDDFARLARVIRRGGTLVTLKGPNAAGEAIASARGVRTARVYVQPDAGALDRIAQLLAGDLLRIAVERIFPLAEVAAAHAQVERGHVRGRILLDLGGTHPTTPHPSTEAGGKR